MESDLGEKIRWMAQYLDEDGIARALNVETALVRAVLAGKAVETNESSPGIRVTKFAQVRHRQQVVAFLHVRGGVGTTTIAANLANYLAVEENLRVLLIDFCAVRAKIPVPEGEEWVVHSDVLWVFRVGGDYMSPSDQPKTWEVNGIHYYPYLPPFEREGGRMRRKDGYGYELINQAKREYDYIILDLPAYCPSPGFGENPDVEAALDVCTAWVYVMHGGTWPEYHRLYWLGHKFNIEGKGKYQNKFLVVTGKDKEKIRNYYESLIEKLDLRITKETRKNPFFFPLIEAGIISFKNADYQVLSRLMCLIDDRLHTAEPKKQQKNLFQKIFR